MKKLTYIDLFAGIGGFHQVLSQLGLTCVFSSEINEQAKVTYKENYGTDPFGDITKIKAKDIPNHDILCAGFPCQAFSKSGKQKGFDDIRGTLFFDIIRIAKEKKTKILFLENVSNLKIHDEGRTFKIMKEALEKEGYVVSTEVLNAKDFGLPQSRERIIIVASREKQFDFSNLKKIKSLKPIKSILDENNYEILKKEEYTILDKKLWKKQKSGLIFCGYRNKAIRSKGVKPNTEHLSRVHKQHNRIYHVDGTHPTISSQEASGRFFVFDGKRVRKLTLRECYRLQGFRDDFKIHSKKIEAYRQIGNSVPINLIKAVAKEILNQYFKK